MSVVRNGQYILDHVSFDLNRGSILAIVGPNGAGKTTLIRALMNLIQYDGTKKWHGKVRFGYVPQSNVRTDFPLSVREFLNFKQPSDLNSIIRSVGMKENILDKSLDSLSGGELQRVLLAWATADFPDIVFFDEPTSQIDIGAVEPIYERVRSLRDDMNITVVIVTHNLHVAVHYSDYVLGLNRKILYFGPTRDLTHEKLVSLMSGDTGYTRPVKTSTEKKEGGFDEL